jgi:hypothetical protein
MLLPCPLLVIKDYGHSKASSRVPCCSHPVTMPFPCHSPVFLTSKGLDCVFPIWFTQCGRVWFTHAMPRPCHATTMPFWKRFSRPRHSAAWVWHGRETAWRMWISLLIPNILPALVTAAENVFRTCDTVRVLHVFLYSTCNTSSVL